MEPRRKQRKKGSPLCLRKKVPSLETTRSSSGDEDFGTLLGKDADTVDGKGARLHGELPGRA